MRYFLTFTILLIGLTTQQCAIGCLKCNNQNQCLLCDITNGYQLNASTCKLTTQVNCNLFAQTGNCVQCNPNYYMDINSQSCLAISVSNTITNCQLYNSVQACVQCSNGFFLSGTNCVAVNSTVANCASYSANGVCKACNSNFILSNDLSACIALPSSSSCLFYTYIGCRSCKSGFVLNQNNYFNGFNNANTINSYLTNIVSPSNNWIGLSVCQAVTVSNCAIYSAFNTCTVCNPGYFIQSGNCVAFPQSIIFGCATYSSLTTCSSCLSGLFLSQNLCVANSVINNCFSYSTSSSLTTCLQCNTGYFLQGNNCVNRTASLSINNCLTPSATADVCSVCAVGFQLTSDNLACLPLVPNCQIYSVSNYNAAALQCSLCASGFFLYSNGNSVICTSGTVPNCLKYSVNANVCTACTNGFYLQNGICNQHVNIPNCQVYDPAKQNFCSACTSGYYNFALTTVCTQTTVKANCAVYAADGNSCQTCSPGYYLVAGACNSIPSTYANCNQYSGNACTLCNSGYMVDTLPVSGTCVLPLDYINASGNNSPCAVMDKPGASSTPYWSGSLSVGQMILSCITCNSYMYGYNPNNAEAICVNQNQLTLYNGFVSINQCKRYGMNYNSVNPNVVCMECSAGYFISGYQMNANSGSAYIASTNPNGIQCVPNCSIASTNSAAVIPDDFFGFVNICVPAVTVQGTVSLQLAAGAIQFFGNCQRYARYRYTVATYASVSNPAVQPASVQDAINTMLSRDYKCIIAAPTTTTNTPPANYLLLDNALTTPYSYERVSLTNPRNSEPSGVAAWDFTSGYSNTVDSVSVHPTVFNYKGILEQIRISSDTSANALIGNNNLQFCEIVYSYVNTGTNYGYAFNNVNGANYKTLALPTANNPIMSCLRCAFGYQLTYTPTNNINTNPLFPSCTSMQNCASGSTVYGGLSTFLNSIFSCHLCGQTNGSNTYPSIWIETTAGTAGIIDAASNSNFAGWTVNSIYSSATNVNINHGFKCLAAPSTVYVSSANPAGSINNCAAYGYITPITTTATGNGGANAVTSSPQQTVCLACAANSYPVYAGAQTTEMSPAAPTMSGSGIPGWSVQACVPSLNCDTNQISIFNGCVRCSSAMENQASPVYFAFHDFTMTNCFQSITQNCLTLNSNGQSQTSQTNTCWVCKAGYFLNNDGSCEHYIVPNQSITNSNFNKAWFSSNFYNPSTGFAAIPANAENRISIRVHYLLSFGQVQYGVTSCNSGWVQFPVNQWSPRICVWSSYIYNNTGGFPATSQYITNCLMYNVTTVNGKNLCGGCNIGFIPTIDGVSCVSSTSLPHCQFAQTGTNTALCYQCMPNYYNVNGQCVNTPIANCVSYVNTQWSFLTPSVLQCAVCFNGFVLSSDSLTCSHGNINNCISYTQGQSSSCVKCASGFSLMKLVNNINYCYPFPSSLNCHQLNDLSSMSGLNYGTISCALCNQSASQVYGIRQWSSVGSTSQPQTMCMPFTVIPNCQMYDQNNTIATQNTFACVQCNAGYWYMANNATCVPRSNNPNQCVTFSLTSDTCTACSGSTFLSADSTNCLPFPSGIFQCSQYSGPTTCTQCNAGYYLLANSCAVSTPILNCAIYSANYTCSACNSGFFLFNSTACVTPTATNCLTFSSITVCSSCPVGFGLQTTNGATSCVSNTLANCVNATTTAPFTCLVCQSGYYPNQNGVCQAVSQTITRCLIYDTASTCVACQTGSVLNVARTACNSTFYTSMIDPNCQQSFLTNSPNCAQCSLGSYFSNGTCVQCSNNTLSSGCLSCDPTNVNNCLVCKPSYYMNAQGSCVSVNPTPTAPTTTNSTKNATVSITRAVLVGLALVTLYFDAI